MLIVISPAKKLNIAGAKPNTYTLPQFINKSEKLITTLKKYTPKTLTELMNISLALADLNMARYIDWEKEHHLNNAKQAILTFTGEVYNGLNAASFSTKEFNYAQNHLRILSGLYGVLKPMDLIHAYRLEMGTKLKVDKTNNLYEFWGDKITTAINKVLSENKSKVLLNLASNEYMKSINKKKLIAPIITPVFKDFNNGKYKMVMVYAKKARGMMASFVIKNRITNYNDIIAFNENGYCYNQAASTANELVFYRG